VRTLYRQKVTQYWVTDAQSGKISDNPWRGKINLTIPIRNEEQLDREAEKLLVDIQQSAWENILEIKRRTKGNNYPKEIRDLTTDKKES
jgi:hypothetical protein